MIKSPEKDELFQEIIKLESIEECYDFFDDLCTIAEITDLAYRMKAAKKILEGKTYKEIIDEISISSATLSRVSKCVQYGNGGYKHIIEKKNITK